MNCLCCGKELADHPSSLGWHKACIKRFFGTDHIPELDISENSVEMLANESINRGYTVTGVQKKLSLHLLSGDKTRLAHVNYSTGFILKLQVKEYANMPESEHLVMSMADASGIATVPHALVYADQGLAYITKRVDRNIQSDDKVQLLAMEDFCQLDYRLTQDKYRGSYERCAKIILRHSIRPGLDLSELFLRLVFCFLTGNSDMHLKNFSLLETREGSGQYTLSPAYDLLPVNVILPEDTEEFALPMNGKKRNLRRKDFLVFAEQCNINRKAAEKMIEKLVSMQKQYEDLIAESLLPEVFKDNFLALLTKRVEAIK